MNEDVLRSWAVDAQKMLDNLQAENEVLKEHLELLHGLIVDGAKEGFNPMEGDWAEKLFISNGKTYKLIKGDE